MQNIENEEFMEVVRGVCGCGVWGRGKKRRGLRFKEQTMDEKRKEERTDQHLIVSA